jgi:hypothetical protein
LYLDGHRDTEHREDRQKQDEAAKQQVLDALAPAHDALEWRIV